MPKVALPPVADWTLGTGLETSGSGIIRLKKWQRTIFSDDFSDSSLDANWTAITAGSGTVTETTVLTCAANGAATDGAAVVYETVTHARTDNYKFKVKFKGSAYTGITQVIQLATVSDGVTQPTACPGAYTASYYLNRLNLNTARNKVSLTHNITGTEHYLQDSTNQYMWHTGSSGASIWTLTDDAYYWYVIEHDNNTTPPTHLVKLYSDDESTLIQQIGYISKQNIYHSDGTHHWMILGKYIDVFPQRASVIFGGFWHYGLYVTTSPEAESPWIAIDSDTLDGTTPIDLIENINGGTGSLKYQYAYNNGAYNGSWVTEAAMKTALQDLAITDHTNSLRIKAQFISDGDQPVELGIASYILADAVTAGGGGARPEIRGGNL